MGEGMGMSAADDQRARMAFDRYTDRARRVLVIAQDEARNLRHSHVSTGHLLCGLIGEGGGVAAQALKSFGNEAGMLADARRVVIRSAVGTPGDAPGLLPFTPRLAAVLSLAAREAVMLGNNYIATEHLLLGLAAGSDPGASPLVAVGVNPDEVRAKVLAMLKGYEEAGKRPVTAEPAVSADRLTAALQEIRERGYENGAHGAWAARLSDTAAIDVPRLLAALDFLLDSHAAYVTRKEHDRLTVILNGTENAGG